ncbi:MAG: DUF2007 domain-containing protein, partial [Alistipes sp.]|nr:DUF2007 domain-containing protein [Alistipes sp.]
GWPEYNTSLEAEVAKSLLVSASIDADIRNEYMSTLYPSVIPSQLIVPEKDAEQAELLLKQR